MSTPGENQMSVDNWGVLRPYTVVKLPSHEPGGQAAAVPWLPTLRMCPGCQPCGAALTCDGTLGVGADRMDRPGSG